MMADVGVVLAVRDGEEHLPGALRSVTAQTLRPVDVVVVDDASTDRTRAIAQAAGVRVVGHDAGNCAHGRNLGLREVRGEYIAFLDQDDVWLADKLSRQVDALERQPVLSFVGALSRVVLAPGCPRPSWWKPVWDQGIPEPSLLPSAVTYRRSAFDLVGVFDERPALSIGDDMDWTARAQDLGLQRDVIDRVLVERLIHHGNLSNDRATVTRTHLAIARASIARKRLR